MGIAVVETRINIGGGKQIIFLIKDTVTNGRSLLDPIQQQIDSIKKDKFINEYYVFPRVFRQFFFFFLKKKCLKFIYIIDPRSHGHKDEEDLRGPHDWRGRCISGSDPSTRDRAGGGGGTGPQAERQLQVVGGANIHSTVVQL